MSRLICFILCIFCIINLSSCNETVSRDSDCLNSSVYETDKIKRYDISLNTENYWKYIDITGVFDLNKNKYDYLIYKINGVLSFAYYEDIIITFDYYVHQINGTTEYNHHADIEVKLNAGGNCQESIIRYDDVSYNFTPALVSHMYGQNNVTSLYDYDRHLSVKNISGIVRFSI